MTQRKIHSSVCSDSLRLWMIGFFMVSAVSWNVAGGAVPPIVVETANTATLTDLLKRLDKKRVVYVGETHTAFADHLLQLDVLRGMSGGEQPLALGVEWFQQRFQPVLDAYVAGDIDEAEMLRRTEYYERWRFDYRLYRPVMQFARDHAIPIIALNASHELTSEIRRVGIEKLSDAFKQQLPDGYDFTDKAYEENLRQVFAQHGGKSDFRRFLEVQLTWDESMADRAARYLKDHPDGRLLVLAGRGHIAGRSGIPNRVTRRTGLKGATVANYSPQGTARDEADFLVLAGDAQLPPSGLMQVILDEHEDGLFVKDFSADSPAQAAGVEKGDRILAINGAAIHHFVDLKIAMLDQQPGSDIVLRVQREGFFKRSKTLDITFKLAGIPDAIHP